MTAPQTFYERMDDWIDRLLATNPVGATQLGDHRFDDRLGAFSLAELEDQNREIKAALAEIEAMSTETWSTDGCIDHTVTVQLLK